MKKIITTDHPYVIRNKASSEIQDIPLWIIQWLSESLTKNISISENIYYSKKFILTEAIQHLTKA